MRHVNPMPVRYFRENVRFFLQKRTNSKKNAVLFFYKTKVKKKEEEILSNEFSCKFEMNNLRLIKCTLKKYLLKKKNIFFAKTT